MPVASLRWVKKKQTTYCMLGKRDYCLLAYARRLAADLLNAVYDVLNAVSRMV